MTWDFVLSILWAGHWLILPSDYMSSSAEIHLFFAQASPALTPGFIAANLYLGMLFLQPFSSMTNGWVLPT